MADGTALGITETGIKDRLEGTKRRFQQWPKRERKEGHPRSSSRKRYSRLWHPDCHTRSIRVKSSKEENADETFQMIWRETEGNHCEAVVSQPRPEDRPLSQQSPTSAPNLLGKLKPKSSSNLFYLPISHLSVKTSTKTGQSTNVPVTLRGGGSTNSRVSLNKTEKLILGNLLQGVSRQQARVLTVPFLIMPPSLREGGNQERVGENLGQTNALGNIIQCSCS